MVKKLFLSCDFLSIWSDVRMVFFGVIIRVFLNTYSLGYSAFKPEELDLPVGAVEVCCGGRSQCVLVEYFDLPVELYEFVVAEGRQKVEDCRKFSADEVQQGLSIFRSWALSLPFLVCSHV